ncbi:hypothetical protein N7G274_002126 [Stereocaulon virgatum]|uniref:Uncharacterized protein n=1 Tax=Stereocaulon virgatum TaxID=373712 RepID=A0ABR4ALI1_9LECA
MKATMSVLTKILLLNLFLPLIIHCAPNKNSDDANIRSRNVLRHRQNGLAFPNLDSYTSFPTLPSGLAPLSNNLATTTTPFVVPSGTANTGVSTGAAGYQPFPTDGAPYQNDTSANGQASSYPFAAAPTSQPPAAQSIENAANQVGQSAVGNQCPSPETITLPPQIVTQCAQIVTVTATPPTVTICPQIQTQAVTITVTVTAGPAPPYQDNTGSPQALPTTAAPPILPPLEGPNASAAASVPLISAFRGSGGLVGQGTGNSSSGTQISAPTGGQASDLLPTVPSGQDTGNLGLGNQTSALPGAQASDMLPTVPSGQDTGNLGLGSQTSAPPGAQASDLLPSISNGQDTGSSDLGSQPPAPTGAQASDLLPTVPNGQDTGNLGLGSQPSAPPGGQASDLLPSISNSQDTGSSDLGSQPPAPTGAQASDLLPTVPSGQDTGNLGLGSQPSAPPGGQASDLSPILPNTQVPGLGTNAAATYPTDFGVPAATPAAAPSAAPSEVPALAPAVPSVLALPSDSAILSIPPASNNVPGVSGLSPSNAGQESVLGATPLAPTNGQASARASSAQVTAPSGNASIPAPSGNALGQPFGAPPVPLPSAPYQNTTGPLNRTALIGSGLSGTMPRIEPTGSSFFSYTGGPTTLSQRPLPSEYQIQFPPSQATDGTLTAGATIQIILPPAIYGTPTPLPSAGGSQIDTGPNSAFHQIPAGSTPRPMPPVNQSDVQGPQLSPFSVGASCSLNNTLTQNVTAKYDNLHSSSPNTPLLYLGLNYTSFTLSKSKSSQIIAEPAATPKAITVAAPFLSFGLNSISISCGDNLSPGNCSVHITALGAPSIGTNSAPTTAMLRTILLEGNAAQKVWFDGTWIGLSQVNFTAEKGGKAMAVGVSELCYEIISAC